MKVVRLGMVGLSALSVILCVVGDAPSYGAAGWQLIIFTALPAVMGAVATARKIPLTRRQSGICAALFLIAAMKSQDALGNVMMATFFGMMLSLVLTIRPERAIRG